MATRKILSHIVPYLYNKMVIERLSRHIEVVESSRMTSIICINKNIFFDFWSVVFSDDMLSFVHEYTSKGSTFNRFLFKLQYHIQIICDVTRCILSERQILYAYRIKLSAICTSQKKFFPKN